MRLPHELGVDPGDHGSDAIREWTNTVVLIAVEHSDFVELTLNLSWVEDDDPSLADAIRSATVQAHAAEGTVRRAPPERVREPLADLLDRSSALRYLALESVVLVADGVPVARLHPESDSFEFDGEHAPGLEASLRSALEGTPTRLVETGLRAELRVQGDVLRIDPPNLVTRSKRAFHLTTLDTVTIDSTARSIRFGWRETAEDIGSSDGILGRARSALGTGTNRPELVEVDSETEFEAAVDALEDLAPEYGFAVVARTLD